MGSERGEKHHPLHIDDDLLADVVVAEDEVLNEYRAALVARWLNFIRIKLCIHHFGEAAVPEDLAAEAEQSIMRDLEAQHPGFDSARFRRAVTEDCGPDGQPSSRDSQES